MKVDVSPFLLSLYALLGYPSCNQRKRLPLKLMRLFSHRQGIKPYTKEIQHANVDDELRSRLWTLLQRFIWDKWNENYPYDSRAREVEELLDKLWFQYFKKPVDERPPMFGGKFGQRTHCYNVLKSNFFKCPWNEVYDFIEFVTANVSAGHIEIEALSEALNEVLTEENSAYRMLGGQFAPITSEAEMAEVEAAASTKLDGVRAHLSAAIAFLSHRKAPDYRNSIKESILAVESLMKVLTGTKSAILSDGLKKIDSVVELHPALRQAFEKLYAYTSDEGGVRHAIFDKSKVTHGDAKFFLVSCSAFINYVLEKFAEKNQDLK